MAGVWAAVTLLLVVAIRPPQTGIEAEDWTLLAAGVLLVVIGFVARAGRRTENPLLLLLALGALVAYGLGTVALLFDADFWAVPRSPTASEFSRGILIAAASTGALAVGLHAGSRRRHRSDVNGQRAADGDGSPESYGAAVVVAALGIMFVAGALALTFGVRLSAVEAGPFAYLGNLFDRNLAMMLVVTLYVMCWARLNFATKVGAALVLSSYVAVTLIQGSRGGLVVPIILMVVGVIVRDANPKLSRRQVVAVTAAFILTSFVIYPIGSGIRAHNLHGADVGEVATRTLETSQERQLGAFSPVVSRQMRMDQLVAIGSGWAPEAHDQSTLRAIPIRAVSSLVPGFSAPRESYLLPSELYLRHYRGWPHLNHGVGSSAAAEAWFLFQNGWAFVALFCWGAASAWIFRWLRRFGRPFGFILQVITAYQLVLVFVMSGNAAAATSQTVRLTILVAVLFGVLAIARRRRLKALGTSSVAT